MKLFEIIKNDPAMIVAVVLGSCVAYSGVFAMPLWVGVVTDTLKVSPSVPGYMGTVQLGAAALSSLWISRNLGKYSPRHFAAFGMVLLIIANGLSTISDTVAMLFIMRGLSGVAEGILLANLNAVISRTANPDRYFALSLTTVGVFGILVFATVPDFISQYGPLGIFGFVVLVGGVALFSIGALPASNPINVASEGTTGLRGASETASLSSGGLPFLQPLAALAIIFVGCQGAWAYFERMGVDKGFSIGSIGGFLIGGQVISLFGPVSANVVGSWLGGRTAILVGVMVSGLAVILASQPLPDELYQISAGIFQFGTLFIVTSYLGFLAQRDASGQNAAAAPAFMNLGSALGPASMGLMLGWGGFPAVGWAVIATYVLGVGLLVGRK